MSNIFKLCPTHLPGGTKNFLGVSPSAANWARKLHTDSWARYRQLTIRQARNAAIYRKFKHASQTLDCDQGITSVPIGKLQLLD